MTWASTYVDIFIHLCSLVLTAIKAYPLLLFSGFLSHLTVSRCGLINKSSHISVNLPWSLLQCVINTVPALLMVIFLWIQYFHYNYHIYWAIAITSIVGLSLILSTVSILLFSQKLKQMKIVFRTNNLEEYDFQFYKVI